MTQPHASIKLTKSMLVYNVYTTSVISSELFFPDQSGQVLHLYMYRKIGGLTDIHISPPFVIQKTSLQKFKPDLCSTTIQ